MNPMDESFFTCEAGEMRNNGECNRRGVGDGAAIFLSCVAPRHQK
jgi:hypothetical protein